MRFIRTYFLPILTAFAMLLFFTHDFGLIDIEHTAIIVALGVDKGDNGQYEISTQIAIPQASASENSNSESIISAKGKTIGEAIDKIAVNTGWYPLFSFCNLIVLGQNALGGNVMDIMNFFIRTDRIPDSATLCVSEVPAKELLLSNTPLDSVSSVAIKKILEQDYAKLDRIANVNVKNFVDGYYSKSSKGYLPLIKKVPSGDGDEAQAKGGSNEKSGGSGGSSSGGSGGSSSGGSGGSGGNSGSSDSEVYDASTTIFFSKGIVAGTLSAEETLLFNLKNRNSIDTFVKLENIEINGQTTDLLVEIDETHKEYGFKFENDKPVYEVKLEAQCRIESANADFPVSELFPSAKAPENVLEATEKKLIGTFENLYRKLQIADCDLFEIKNALYKFHYPKYKLLKDDILNATKLKVEIVCRPKTTTRV